MMYQKSSSCIFLRKVEFSKYFTISWRVLFIFIFLLSYMQMDSVQTVMAEALPMITTSGTLEAFNSSFGGTSSIQSYKINANNLIEALVISAPQDFEVSLASEDGFASQISLSPDKDGAIPEKDIYVRLQPSEAVEYEAAITHASGEAEVVELAVSGSSVPLIQVNGTLSEFTTVAASYSAEQSYSVIAINLIEDLSITAPDGFEISQLSGDGFASQLTLNLDANGALTETTVYVRFINNEAGTLSGSILHSSGDTQNMELTVSGTASEAEINLLANSEEAGDIEAQATSISFNAEELLGCPTDSSITINIVPASTIEYQYLYGTTSGDLSSTTSLYTANTGQPSEVVIDGLSANTKYYYQMQYHLPGETGWVDRTEHSFRTQRAKGDSFSFTVTSDIHGGLNTNMANAMTNIYNENPDFEIDLGDTFMLDSIGSQSAADAKYLAFREPSYFDKIGSSVPIFLSSGNHENEEGWNLDDTFSIALASIQARKAFYPTPIDGIFYSGNTDPLEAINETTYGDEYREDYYAWTWGDALFVVIDPFQYTMDLPYSPLAGEGSDDPVTGDQWSWTLGAQQFQWLKNTLANSDSRYKFVFSHQMVGGITRNASGGVGYVRGGAEASSYFEWGGKDSIGNYVFNSYRDLTDFGTEPIHQLFVDYGVSAYFHGHDHQFVYEKTDDGIVYQEVPPPSSTASAFSGIYTEGDHDGFSTIKVLTTKGHLLITVASSEATVDYISSNSTSGTVDYTYSIEPNDVGTTQYTITASAGDNGSISPSGVVNVNEGNDQTFVISPNFGYQIADVLVDSISVGAVTSYTFNDVTTDHTIVTSFEETSTSFGTVTLDGAVSSGTADGVSTINISHTTGTGTNRLMLVGVSANSYNAAQTISSVTFTPSGGSAEALTLVGSVENESGRLSAIYSLLNPDSGRSGTVTVTFSGTVNNGIVVGVANFAGVDQSDPFDDYASATGTTTAPTLSVTTSGSNELVFDTVFLGAATVGTLSPDSSQSSLWSTKVDRVIGAASTKQATSNSTTLTWSTAGTASTYYWALGAVPINPAAAGITYDLTVAVSPSEGGTTSPAAGTHTYGEGSIVDITATPADGYVFDEWTGACTGTGACSVTMDSDKSVIANFSESETGIVTLDGAVSSGTADGVSTINISHTTGTGTNRLMLVGVSANSYNAAQTISSVTFTPSGGSAEALTLVGSVENESGRLSAIYSLLNPDSGRSGTVTVTFSGTVNNGIVVGVANFAGVDQSDPFDDYASATGTTTAPTLSVTTSGSNELVFDTVFLGAATVGTLSPDSSQSSLWSTKVDRVIGAASTKQATSNSTTLTWSTAGTASTYYWALGAVPINPAAAGITYDLTVAVSPSEAGTTSPAAGTHTYGEGSIVDITATPADGYVFDEWSGACTGTGACSVTMDSDKSVIANFSESETGIVTLDGAVSSGTADGVSTINISHTTGTGINRLMLVGVSANSYNSAQTISSVTFTPSGGSAEALTLVGSVENESGRLSAIYSLLNPDSGRSGTVTVTFSGTVNYGIIAGVANFAGVDQSDPFDDYASATGTTTAPTLSVTTSGSNELVFDTVFLGAATVGTLSPDSSQTSLWSTSVDRAIGAASTKQATSNSTTLTWSTAGTASTYYWALGAVPINPAATGITYDLTVAVSPSEAGTTSPAVGTHTYGEGSIVDITATPADGYVFDEWTGACTGTGACSVTMDSIKSVTANFVESAITYDLTLAVSPSGAGTTSPAAGIHSYDEGSVVNVTSAPAADYVFNEWSGACTGTGACSVTMDSDKSVTANFVKSTTTFTGTEFLGRPEANSITISVVPDSDILLYYEYSTTSGIYTNTTSTVSATGGEPKVVTINGLTIDTEYYYRMQYSTNGGRNWTVRPENSFHTQRATGSTFTFTITSDAHVNIMLGSSSTWTNTLNDINSDNPDFEIDLGDTVAMDTGTASINVGDTDASEQVYLDTLPYLNIISGSTPLFMVAGNHEQQEAWHLTASNVTDITDSLPAMGKNAEKKYFLNPVPDTFYSGDTDTYAYLDGDQLSQAYYAWTWGDALFVVINPYWFTTTKPYTTTVGGGETDTTGSGDRWDWTLGQEQFEWLKNTLENSTASYKFIFSHQIVGGNSLSSPDQVNYGHGGVDSANLVEWGGYNVGGSIWAWDSERSGWGSQTIHQMMMDNKVTAFFHGHDHQYAYEKLDGIVYQSVPSASFTSNFGIYTTGGNNGKTIQALTSTGHLKVTVNSTNTTVDYIRTGATSSAYTYTMEPVTTSYDLTIAVSPSGAGTTSPTVGTHEYDEGSVVDITATPSAGYTFTNWTGDCTGTGNCQVTMGSDKDVIANFTALTYTISGNADLEGVTITYTGGSTTTDVNGDYSFSVDYGWAGTITPSLIGYTFSPTSLSIPAVTDNLTGKDFTAALNAYTISGNADVEGVTITYTGGSTTTDVNGDYSFSVDYGWTGTITPSLIGYAFSPTSLSIPAVSGNMSGQDFTAIAIEYTLSITSEHGTVVKSPDQTTYHYNDAVQLTASPATGFMFSSWSGDLVSTANPASVTINGDMAVTANYTAIPTYTLTVNAGLGGSVALDPAGGTYPSGTVVTLTATPDAEYLFSGWSGDLSGSANPTTITMDGDKTVDAAFTAIPTYTLTVNAGTGGSVALDPAGGTYPSGTVVTLTATPDAEYLFSGWSGDLTGSINPTTITMNGDKTVDASFTQIQYSLTVNAGLGGSVALDPAGGTYPSGTVVTLTATPDTDYLFSSWSGDLSGSVNPTTITMDGDKTVEAAFTAIPTYTLTVNAGTGGSVALDPAGGTYPSGTVVTLTATPDAEYLFSSWSGDLSGSVNPTTITMDGDKTVEAAFTAIPTYTLTVNAGTGGSVALDPAGGTYPSGTVVTLTATPDAEYLFSSWSGDLSGSVNPTTITMDGDKTVGASFTQIQYSLTVNAGLGGSVALDPAGGTYPSGTVVTLTATPDAEYLFSSWSGDLSGSVNPTTITMDGDKTVGAAFTQIQYSLTVNAGAGGSVALDPAGGTYPSGTVVTLTATPDAEYLFSSWSGDLSGSVNPTTITMDGDKTVDASFSQIQYSLTVNAGTGGSVALDPAGGTYPSGTVVTLTATPDTDYLFSSWSGDLSGSVNPTTITMDGDKTVDASFTQIQDTTAPTVTINQKSWQEDPTHGTDFYYEIVFSEMIYNFDESDIQISGTASGPFTLEITGTGPDYTLYVTGVTSSGTIIASIPAGAVEDAAGNPSEASTSTDNSITYYTVPVPGKPVVNKYSTPVQNQLVSSLMPTFVWGASNPDAEYYKIQIATNTSFTNDVSLYQAANNQTTYTLETALSPGKLYYWRVTGFNETGTSGSWSNYSYFRTPLAPPVLLSPEEAETLSTDRTTFEWEDAEGATSYTIQVSTAANFSSYLINKTVSSPEYITTSDLPQNRLLYWRVRAKSKYVNSAWTDVHTFTTGNPPSIPVLVSPANKSLTRDYTPKLDWKNSKTPSSTTFYQYQLQIATDANFSSLTIEAFLDGLSNSSYTIPDDQALDANTTFYWRVRSINQINEESHYSAWSSVWYFRTALTPPILVYPVTGTEIDSLRPTFDWNDVPGATSYTIQVSKYSNFRYYLISKQVTNSEFASNINLPAGKIIYWRVRTNGSNGPSSWSTGSFATRPSTPALVKPAHKQTTNDLTPFFDWKNSTFAPGINLGYYQIQVANDADFNDLVIDEQDITVSNYTPSSELAPFSKFYWRVRAVSDQGNSSSWSGVRYFKTTVAPPILMTPELGAEVDTLRPTYNWTKVENDKSYTIQISIYSNFKRNLLSKAIVSNIYTPSLTLPSGKIIYWRVRANGPNGSSAWSTSSFATQPTTPVLVKPAHRSITTDLTPLFDWKNSTIAPITTFGYYQIQVDTNNDFLDTVIDERIEGDTTLSSFTPASDLPANSKYYWRVRTCTASDICSGWSGVRYFKTTLASPVLSSPAEASVASTRPTFDWDDVPNASSYTIQVSRYSNFRINMIAKNVTNSEYTSNVTLPAGRTLYWRVRANGGNGSSAWVSGSFVTQ